MKPHGASHGLAYRDGRLAASNRELAAEAAVAISYNGSSHAVLMATPSSLEDLAIGFSLSEGIIGTPDAIEDVSVVELDNGFDVQVRLRDDVAARLDARRRAMAGPVGCGMCGLESIEAAMRDLEPVQGDIAIATAQIGEAMRMMARRQDLNLRTRAVHAAGFWRPAEKGGELAAIREDVGRHNALDKLIGSMAGGDEAMNDGAIVVSSRVSIELVQKAASAGCPVLIAASAPTALAVEMADRANITLVAVVRGDEFEVFTHAERIVPGTLPAGAYSDVA